MDYIGLGCCTLAFALYLNTLDAGFVYDDRRAILGNPDLLTNTPWKQIIMNDFWGTPLSDSGSHGSYRPLCVLSYKINYLFGGYQPLGYHLVNVLLHCIATVLVVKLARQLLPPFWGPIVAGALFASHPIHTEAVAGIVGRADLAACNLYLLAFLAYSEHIKLRKNGEVRGSWTALGITILLSAAAVLCKETGIAALVSCVIYDIVTAYSGYHDKNRKRSITIVIFAFVSIVYLRLKLPGSVQEFSTADNPIAKASSLLTRFLTFLYLPAFNFKLLLCPSTLSFDWGMDAIPRITSVFDLRNILSCVFYCSLLFSIYRHVNKMKIHLPIILRQQKQKIRNNKRKRQLQLQQQQQQPPLNIENCNDIHLYNVNNNNSVHNNNNSNSVLNHNCDCELNLTEQVNNVNIPHLNSCPAFYKLHILLYTSLCNGCPFRLNKDTIYSTMTSINDINNNNNQNNIIACNHNNIDNCNINNYKYNSNSHSNNNNSNKNVNRIDNQKNVSNECNWLPSTSAAVLLSISLLTLPFLPAANLFFYVGFVVAERILYLPSVGYCLLVGLGVGKLMDCTWMPDNHDYDDKESRTTGTLSGRRRRRRRRRKGRYVVYILLCIILVLYSVKTIKRNFDWKNEESLFRSAIGINPPKALGNLGSVLSSQGRYSEAKQALLLALKYRPNMADVHYNLGILYQNHQDYKKAVECFKKAIHFRPSLALAYLNLGTSLIALGRCQEATSVLREGSKLDGSGLRDRTQHNNARISTLLKLGSLYVEQGKLQSALSTYKEALHSLPENYPPQTIYYKLGDILGRLQQWSEAESFHQAALELEPDHVATHVSYGTMLARNSSRTSEAELWFKRALKLAPSEAGVRHHYADFLTSVSRHVEACEQRVRAAELSPKDYSLVLLAASSLNSIDRKLEAENWYRLAVQLRPDDVRSHISLGAILHAIGKSQLAAESYKNALRLQPNNPTALGYLAKLGTSSEAS